jgi:UDP-glucose:(heptosyl)LPS alpha-1,3-glucosyltransferase
MKLAFCLFEYFPFGGMQRDCVRIAKACVESGADVTIFTREWTGPCPTEITVQVLPTKGWTNAGKAKRFVESFKKAVEHTKFDGIVGFSKMPGLDVYYAADPCFVEKADKKYPFFYKWTKNFRTYAAFEKAVFGADSKTEILLINPKEKEHFKKHYQTQDERFHLLPPGILPDRCAPIDYVEKRRLLREGFSLKDDEKLMLFVGSGFKTKGLDRAIKAMSALPKELLDKTQLWVVGDDDPKPYAKLIHHLRLDKKVFFLGGRHDIPELLWVADVLCHPAYSENTGTVLIEAMVAGLPVITTDVCGYASYVKEAQGGIVLASPFEQRRCAEGLAALLTHPEPWRSQGIQYGLTADLYSMVETAQNLIETLVQKKND